MNSKQKGKRGELELVHWLRAHGVKARRGQQFQGLPDSPDIVHDLPGIHLEVKRTEALRLWEALEQAQSDAGGSVGVVCHRANRRPWVAILSLQELIRILVPRE